MRAIVGFIIIISFVSCNSTEKRETYTLADKYTIELSSDFASMKKALSGNCLELRKSFFDFVYEEQMQILIVTRKEFSFEDQLEMIKNDYIDKANISFVGEDEPMINCDDIDNYFIQINSNSKLLGLNTYTQTFFLWQQCAGTVITYRDQRIGFGSKPPAKYDRDYYSARLANIRIK